VGGAAFAPAYTIAIQVGMVAVAFDPFRAQLACLLVMV